MRFLTYQNAVDTWEQGWPGDFTNMGPFYPAGYGGGLSGIGCIGCTGPCFSCGLGASRGKGGGRKQPSPPIPATPRYIYSPGMTLGGLGFAPGPDLYVSEPFPWWLLIAAGVIILASRKR